MEEYLRASEVIDWQHPELIELAKQIASGHETSTVRSPIQGWVEISSLIKSESSLRQRE